MDSEQATVPGRLWTRFSFSISIAPMKPPDAVQPGVTPPPTATVLVASGEPRSPRRV